MAEHAGLKVGDIVLSIDSRSVRFESQLSPFWDRARWNHRRAILVVIQRGAATRTLHVMAAPRLGIEIRPPLPGTTLAPFALFQAASSHQATADQSLLNTAAEAAARANDYRAATWLYQKAYDSIPDGMPQDKSEALARVLGAAKMAHDELTVSRSLADKGVMANSGGKLTAAQAYFSRSLAICERFAPHSLDLAASLTHMGGVTDDLGMPARAAAYHLRALAIRERLAPDSLCITDSLVGLGSAAYDQGKLDESEAYQRRALAIRERLDPGSLYAARIVNNLGLIYQDRGKYDMAEALYSRSLAAKQRLSPESLDVASSVTALGNLAYDRGKLDEAESWYRRSLAIATKHASGSSHVGDCFNSLGNVANCRGNYTEAKAYYRRSLDIQMKMAPDAQGAAALFYNLGIVADNLGQLDEAEVYYKRDLAIMERLAPNSLDVATALNALGTVANERRNLDAAESYFVRSLNIRSRIAPESLELAMTLSNLGNVALYRGRVGVAERYYKRVLALQVHQAPDSLSMADTLGNLGLIEEERNKPDVAETYFLRQLKITQRLAPGSLDLAANLNKLGDTASQRGKLRDAEDQYQEAWKIVKRQAQQVAGDSGRQAFGRMNHYYAADLVSIQLKRLEADAAFVTMEEGRAQALLQAIAERGIAEKATPPEVWSAYRTAVGAYTAAYKDAERSAAHLNTVWAQDNRQGDHAALPVTVRHRNREADVAKREFEQKRSEEIRTREAMETCWADVRSSATAAIPLPLNPKEARKRLEPGLLLLEFTTNNSQVILFASSSVGSRAYALAASRKEIEAGVASARRYAAQESESRGSNQRFGPRASSRTMSRGTERLSGAHTDIMPLRALFSKLFPAEAQVEIQRARHIVISPDEFLWDLPFAALITNTSGAPQYLGLQKPLSYAQSLTVLLTPSSPGSSHGAGVLAIGNPLYDNSRRKESGFGLAQSKAVKSSPGSVSKLVAARRDGELGMLTSDGAAPPQLEYAEQEARQIAALYPHTVAHTGAEPTESWFREHASNARILHLATHGFYNPYSAQSSGVLLAVPETAPPAGQYDNDGTLQAWEVWSLKLKADLVVLSACETGRGAKVTGEGLIGMTRAWQYAGAKTILSSQWKVNDRSTASLMTAFHKHLLAGAERDEALRLAMAEIANSTTPGWSSPYHWAAFVMVGETGKMP